MSKPVPVKRLSELLQDQQEPFKLRVYISERRYINTNSSSECRNGPNGSKLDSSAKNLKSNNSNIKRRKQIVHGSKVLRLVLDMLLISSSKNSSKLPNRGHKCQRDKEKFSKKAKKHHQHSIESSNSRTVFGSCSKRNIVEECYLPIKYHSSPSQRSVRVLKLQKLKKLEAASNTKQQWGYTEESKQRSPVSVLEELPSEEGSPVDNNTKCYLEVREEENPLAPIDDSIFSASLRQLLVQIPIEKQNDAMALIQSEQFIFDCVKEAIDAHGRKATRERSFGEVSGAEELGKIICEQIYSWEKKTEDGISISQVMNSHFSNTVEEWSDFKQTTDDIGIEIGDAILDDIVKEIIFFGIHI